MYRPEKDGIDHINAYSKARTAIGRRLTNYAHAPFDHRLFGHFESIEGFWFWLASGRQYNKLKELHGFQAHELGRVCLENIDYDSVVSDPKFRKWIREAIECKFRQDTTLLQGLIETGDLPIVHYYYDYKNPVIEEARVEYLPQHQWQMDIVMEIRERTQKWMKEKGVSDISKHSFKKS